MGDQQCEKCQDLVHNLAGSQATKFNYMGEVFLVLELLIFLVLIGFSKVNIQQVKHFGTIALALYAIRYIAMQVTNCRADVNMAQRPFSDRSNRWYILSGHTLVASLVAYVVIQSRQVNMPVKVVTCLLTAAIIISQVVTREHFTVDIILTLFIVFLVTKAYPQ